MLETAIVADFKQYFPDVARKSLEIKGIFGTSGLGLQKAKSFLGTEATRSLPLHW